jgi:hypothetical protein
MIGIRTRLIAAAAAAAFALAAAGSASAALNAYKPPNYTFPSGFEGFKLQTHGGDFNPGVLVGFNPQPEPPGDFTPGFLLPAIHTGINLDNPAAPILNNVTDGGAFDFLIALLDLGDGSVMPGDPAPRPNGDGFTRFNTTEGGHDISIFLQFGGGPVGSWSWGAFNPQPDPPGDFASGEIGFAADPFMRFGMNIDGAPVTFSLAGAPEPGTWAMMIVGFGGAGVVLRRARRQATAATAA